LKALFSFSPKGDILCINAIALDFLERVGPKFVSTDPLPHFWLIAASSLYTLTRKEMDHREFEKRSVIGIEKFYAEELEQQYVAGSTVYNA
jgi:hypothetical protein